MRLTRTISIWSGEIVSAVAWVSCAIFPNAECEPVAKTSAFASPETSEVPASSVLRLCIGSGSSHGSASRDAGSDSPVTVALFTRTLNASTRRQSAGRMSPASSRITSPGTSSAAGTCRTAPERTTFVAFGQQFLERRQRLLGAIRLPEREHAIDQDHADDREPERRHALPRLAPLGEEGERRGDPQDDRKEVHELFGKREQQRLVRDFLHFICPELHEPPLRLGLAQSGQSALQAGQGVGDREVVNLHAGLSCSLGNRKQWNRNSV